MHSPKLEEKAGDRSSIPDDATLQGENAQGVDVPETLAPASGQDATVDFLEGFKLLFVLSSLALVIFLVLLDISILGTAIPQITSDFHQLEDVGWYVGAYQLASATVQPLTGKMLNYFSSKWTYVTFFVIFEIGSAICGAAQSSTMLIIGRAIAGLGSSGLVNGSITIIQGACKPQSRPMYTGFVLGLGQIGIVLGPLLGGVFTQYASWRWCFYVNLPLGAIIGALMLFVRIPDHIHKEPLTLPYLRSILPHFDLIGFGLFAPAAIMLLLALQFGAGGQYGWDSSRVIGLFCGAGATAVVFLFWERRMGDDAMIPLAMVRQRVVYSSSLNYALLMVSVIVGSNFMPLYLQSVKGLSPTMSGVYMLAAIISQVMFIVLSGALVSKLGYYIYWAMIACAITAIGCGLVSTWGPHTGLGKLIGYQILLGTRGAGIQMGIVAIQATLSPKMAAVGTSFIVFTQNILGAIFITVGNTIFQESLKSSIRAHAPSISPSEAVEAGGSAEAVRALAPPGPVRDALLQAYSDSFNNVFYLLIGSCCVAFLAAFGMGWVDLRTKNAPAKQDTEATA